MAAAERKRADAIKGLEQFETVVRHGGDQGSPNKIARNTASRTASVVRPTFNGSDT
jgi:hypothetical protein